MKTSLSTLLLFLITMGFFSCKKVEVLPSKDLINGNWKIVDAQYKAGVFKSNENHTEQFADIEYSFSNNGAIQQFNTNTQMTQTGSWSLIEVPYTVNAGDIPVQLSYETIHIKWSQGSTQDWVIEFKNNNTFFATQSDGKGAYTFKMERQ